MTQISFQLMAISTKSVIHLQGNFDKAVEILKPVRYKVDLLGGSRAQVRSNVSLNIRHRHRVQFLSCDKLKTPSRRFFQVNFDCGNEVVT